MLVPSHHVREMGLSWSDLSPTSLLHDATSAVNAGTSLAASIAAAPIKVGVEATGQVLGAARPGVTNAVGLIQAAAPGVQTVLGVARGAVNPGTGLPMSALAPPATTSNMPLIIGGLAAAALIGFALLRRREPSA